MASIKKSVVWDPEAGWVWMMTTVDSPFIGTVVRSSSRRPPSKIGAAQRNAMHALGYTSRYWKEQVTAAKKLRWGTGAQILTTRSGDLVSKHAFTRWTQVQMALWLADGDLEDTNQPRTETDMRSLEILGAYAETQTVLLSWDWRRGGAGVERVAIHVSQVPARYIGTDHLWKYAVWAETYDQLIQLGDDAWHNVQRYFTMPIAYAAGDAVQLYIRVTKTRNVNPPISNVLSHETVEDWTAFIATAE